MLCAVSGAAAVGFNVIRAGPAAAQPEVAIVTSMGVDVPLPDPDATSGGSEDIPQLTVPVNGAAWALVATTSARPAVETIVDNLRIKRLLLELPS
jgi:hypothetical protein